MNTPARFYILMLLTALLSASARGNEPARTGLGTTLEQTPTLTDSQQAHTTRMATEWGLTEAEWQRYEQLRQGRRGIQSPAADPVTLMGLEARTAEERRHFAEILVRQEKARTDAELALQREYNAAWQRLWPELMRVGVATSRLAIFVRSDCGAACREVVERVVNEKRHADLYLVDSGGNDDVVRRWATAQRIPASQVRDGTLTLNHDNGHWLRQGQGRMPAVMKQNAEGQWIHTAL